MKEQGKTPEIVTDLTQSEVARAKSLCVEVEFSPMDATRSDFEFMMRVCQLAVESGATVINIPDTTGDMTHRQYGGLIATIRQRIHAHHPEVVISAHTHGDRGLSAAANLEAIGAGARQIEVAVNGLGPRLGNAGLADIVGNIREGGEPLPPNVYTGVDARRLRETSQLVAELSGKAAPDNLAFTSPTAFAHAEGIHQHDVAGNPRSFEALDAEVYGQAPGQIVLGPLSGRVGVGLRLKNIGIVLEKDDLNTMTARVKELAVQQGRNLADNDIESLAATITGEEVAGYWHLDRVEAGESNGVATAKVRVTALDHRGKAGKTYRKRVRLPGEGAIDAMITAINEASVFDGSLENWGGGSKEPGADAVGGIFVQVKAPSGHSVTVHAEGNSVLQATANAYMIGRNMIPRVQRRDPNYRLTFSEGGLLYGGSHSRPLA